jgi:hypothetical protein
MTIKTDVDLKAAFEGRETKPAPEETGEVPESIRKHAPALALRPGGSWKARADAIDQRVREAQDAAKARSDWAARIKTRHRDSMRMSFKRSARGD